MIMLDIPQAIDQFIKNVDVGHEGLGDNNVAQVLKTSEGYRV